MNMTAFRLVQAHSKTRGNALALMLWIALHTDDEGVMRLKIDEFARMAKLTPRTVRDHLRKLERAGEITPVPVSEDGVVAVRLKWLLQ